jgi:phytanoyl-CoA hydroxylase
MPSLNGMDFLELKKTYDEDGFVVIPGYLSEEEVKELREKTEALMSDFQFGAKFNGVRKNLDKTDPWFGEYFHTGAQVPLIAGLMNDKPEPSSAAFFDKPAGSSVEISQHVDGLGTFDGATIWIALDPADCGNGCLNYVKGSHKQTWDGNSLSALNENSDGAIAVEAKPGDAIIHSAKVVHWSRKSSCTTRRRRAISMFYWTTSCLENKESWPGQNKAPQQLAASDLPLKTDAFDLQAGENTLRNLNREWASKPEVAQKFRSTPNGFLKGLRSKDPDACDAILAACRRASMHVTA